MARVSPQQIQEVARRTFSADKLHLCAVGPRVKRLKKSILADIARALPRAR